MDVFFPGGAGECISGYSWKYGGSGRDGCGVVWVGVFIYCSFGI